MKKLILIVLLPACGNHKADIVEQQKKLQDEIARADVKAFLFKREQLPDSVRAYEYKSASLKSRLDSLETELKKY